MTWDIYILKNYCLKSKLTVCHVFVWVKSGNSVLENFRSLFFKNHPPKTTPYVSLPRIATAITIKVMKLPVNPSDLALAPQLWFRSASPWEEVHGCRPLLGRKTRMNTRSTSTPSYRVRLLAVESAAVVSRLKLFSNYLCRKYI